MSIRLRVPATSANLGPGFDVLGVALDLYNCFAFEPREAGLEIVGCDPAYATEENLAVRAWRAVESHIGSAPSGLQLHIATEVPVARGLGSSATLLAAGAAAANRAHGDPLSRMELLDIIARLEGHPDNVAPALLGGLRASMRAGEELFCAEYPVHPGVGFCALIPDFETSTRLARAALPSSVPFQDAAYNLSRLPLLLRALQDGDLHAIGAALDDRLHQPYRKALIHEYDRVERTALALGAAGFCISGSGSTLMALVASDAASDFASAMEDALADSAHHWRAHALHVDREGTAFLP